MRNNELLPYDTIVQATSGEPEAVNTVLQYYGRRIRYASRISGQADKEAEDFITETLLKALFKFRFMTDKKEHIRHSMKSTAPADCVTEIRIGNSVLVVSGFFKQGAKETAADKMAKVLEAEAATK